MGGENNTTLTLSTWNDGSSPRGRGKHRDADPRRRQEGLIPAWAGKTGAYSVAWSSGWAHPRVGGENDPTDPTHPLATGSSPRGRGKRGQMIEEPKPGRLIPAWAGKTYFLIAPPRRAWAHPRVGGENLGV